MSERLPQKSQEREPDERKKPRKISDKDFEEYFGVPLDADLSDEGGAKDEPESKQVVKRRPKEEAIQPPLDLQRVVFTKHAIDRFEERFHQLNPKQSLSDARQTVLKILAHAKEKRAIGSGWKVKRLMAHEYEEARYFLADGWRFVVQERDGKLVVVTVERKK